MTAFLAKICSGSRHDVCMNNINYFKNSMANLTKVNFDRFMDTIIQNGNYNNCLSSYSNKNYNDVIQFMILASTLVEINVQKLISAIQYTAADIDIKKLIENQMKFNPKFINEMILCKTAKSYYGSTTNFLSQCVSSKRLVTFKYILENIDVETFYELINQTKETIPAEIEKNISEFISKNEENLKNYNKILNVVDSLINKPRILKSIYTIIGPNLSSDKKIVILNKIVNSSYLDPSLILVIMEGNDIIPNDITFTNLLSKVYFRTSGAPNSSIIAEIIDIFVLYGFKITKDIIFTLLRKGCYVNSIEKHSIEVDESILEVCAELSYYPYEFKCVPPTKVMLKECSKDDNLIQIKKLKEKGGVINVDCLERACGVKKNGRTIKYIINECKVKPNDFCLVKFQETYGLEALDLLMQNYSNNKENDKKPNNKINLDNESTMSIERRNIEINSDNDYTLKNKIKKLFDYKKKTIKYVEVYELMLKYLINKNLIIGNYFIINNELHNLTKMSQCTIVNLDQIDNLLSYFIDITT